MMGTIKRVIKLLFTGEMFLALYLYVGFFKEELTFIPSFFDLTAFFGLLIVAVIFKRLYIFPFITKRMLLAISLYLVIGAIMLGSIIYTTSEVYAQEKILKFFSVTSLAFFGSLFIIRTKESLEKFLISIVFISVGMSIGLFFWIDYTMSGDIYINNYASIGRSAGIGLLIALCLVFLNNMKTTIRIIGIFIIGLLSFSLISSGVRMPLIATVIACIILVLSSFRIKNNILYFKKGIKWLILLLFMSIIVIIPFINSNIIQRSFNRLLILLEVNDNDPTGRLERYSTVIDTFSSSPILGEGIGSFGISYIGVDEVNYPHNIFLEFLTELGFIGFSLFFIMIILTFINYYNLIKEVKREKRYIIIATTLAFIYTFLNANVAGDINDNRILFAFIALSFSVQIGTKLSK